MQEYLCIKTENEGNFQIVVCVMRNMHKMLLKNSIKSFDEYFNHYVVHTLQAQTVSLPDVIRVKCCTNVTCIS